MFFKVFWEWEGGVRRHLEAILNYVGATWLSVELSWVILAPSCDTLAARCSLRRPRGSQDGARGRKHAKISGFGGSQTGENMAIEANPALPGAGSIPYH